MMNLVCPKCGAPVQFADSVCPRCGESLAEVTSSTLHMRIDPELLRRRHSYPASNTTLEPEQAVCLKIRGLIERVVFEEQTQIVLGRVELNQSAEGILDLTRYGALQRGVSRAHARLQYAGSKLTISDLGSVNGTWINEHKLEPNQPVEVHNGDELLLGHLPVKVTFENTIRSRAADADGDTVDLSALQKLQAEWEENEPNSGRLSADDQKKSEPPV